MSCEVYRKFSKWYTLIETLIEIQYITIITLLFLGLGIGYSNNELNWQWVERVVSLIIVCGAVLAARRYLMMGVKELFISQTVIDCRSYGEENEEHQDIELITDITAAKIDFCLSIISTIINGWGSLLGWWYFSLYLLIPIFALSDYMLDRNIINRKVKVN